MLITPRPGADRKVILRALQGACREAELILLDRGTEEEPFDRLLHYLEWTTIAAHLLRPHVSDKDLDHLVFTPSYHSLLGSCGSLEGDGAKSQLVYRLVELAADERIQALQEAEAALDAQILNLIG
ncbi:hypothetical protein [Streptomyces sp. NPDC005731]|uniref:hypothetical protein n=1 Tax=Streptomyces sp. NPDC005731 TaxID=3157056 RepID=UPI0033D906E6